VTTVLNPAPVQRLGDDLLQLVDYLIPNSGEADALTDIEVGDPDTAREAASRLRERGVGTVIVTLGEQGALVLGAETAIHFPAFPIQAVDTTAAGDAFTGAFSLGLAAGGTLEQAIPLASAAAALTCTRRGAQSSLPDRGAVEAFLRRLRDSAPR
jgi:ribokinase